MSGKQFSLDSRLDLFHGIEETKEKESTSLPDQPSTLVEVVDENEERSDVGKIELRLARVEVAH